jgi:hypothetical protein
MSSILLALLHSQPTLLLAAIASPILAGAALRLLPGALRSRAVVARPEGG